MCEFAEYGMTEEILTSEKDWLRSQITQWTRNGPVCWGKTRYIDEDKPVCKTHGACHSWVQYAYGYACCGADYDMYTGNYNIRGRYVKGAKNFLVSTCHSRRRSRGICSPEAADFLVRWIAHDSPFSRYVLNKDDESLTDGGVILFCGPNGLRLAEAMWVCKVLRLAIEGAQGADTFMTLVQAGVDAMLSLYIASHVRNVKGATFGYTGLDAHSCVVGDQYKTDLRGLLNREANKRAETTQTLFNTPVKGPPILSPALTVKGFCTPSKKSDGWGGTVTADGVSKEDLIRKTLEWQAEILGRKEPLPTRETVYLEADF